MFDAEEAVLILIKSIDCYAVIPPVASQWSFDNQIYSQATLSIPEESYEAYSNESPWNLFAKVELDPSSAVRSIINDDVKLSFVGGDLVINGVSQKSLIEVIDMKGQMIYHGYDNCIHGLQRGIYIIRIGDYVTKINL